MHAYSDGSAVYEFFIAVVLLTMSFRVCQSTWRALIDARIRRLADALRSTGLFSSTISLSGEAYRLDFLRIVIGTMTFWHYLPEFISSISIDATSSFWFGFAVVTSACVTVGFLTPLAALLLMLTLNTLIVNITASISIGALVIAMCMLPIALAPAGYTLSLDAFLLRRWSMTRRLYAFWGAPTIDRFQIGRFLALVAFCAINIYSALNHLEWPTWRSGMTTGIVLLFPTTNVNYSAFIDSVYAAAPAFFVLASKLTTWGMLFWQILLLPLVLYRFTRPLAILWGIAFFTISTYVLNIKTLGIYEYVLFAIIFWSRAGIDGRGRDTPLQRLLLMGSSVRQNTKKHAARIAKKKTPVFAATVLTFSILLAAFTLRLPHVSSVLPVLPTVSRIVIGSAPQAVGLGSIDVFNFIELRMYQSKIEGGFYTGTGERLPREFLLPEWMHAYLTQDLRKSVVDQDPAYCTEAFGDRIARYYGEKRTEDDSFEDTFVVINFFLSTQPSFEDFKNYRYAPITWQPSCTTVASVTDPDHRVVTYFAPPESH